MSLRSLPTDVSLLNESDSTKRILRMPLSDGSYELARGRRNYFRSLFANIVIKHDGYFLKINLLLLLFSIAF